MFDFLNHEQRCRIGPDFFLNGTKNKPASATTLRQSSRKQYVASVSLLHEICRSSRPEVFYKIRPEAYNFIKKRLWHTYFTENFEKYLRTLFFAEHLQVTASEFNFV